MNRSLTAGKGGRVLRQWARGSEAWGYKRNTVCSRNHGGSVQLEHSCHEGGRRGPAGGKERSHGITLELEE